MLVAELVGDEVLHRPADRHRVVVWLAGQVAALAVVQLERRAVRRQAEDDSDLRRGDALPAGFQPRLFADRRHQDPGHAASFPTPIATARTWTSCRMSALICRCADLRAFRSRS